MQNLTYIIATKTIGRTNARKTVVILGRTRVISRFLTVNVHTCLKKQLIVAASFATNLGEDVEEASTARQGIIISWLSYSHFVLTPGVSEQTEKASVHWHWKRLGVAPSLKPIPTLTAFVGTRDSRTGSTRHLRYSPLPPPPQVYLTELGNQNSHSKSVEGFSYSFYILMI